MDTSIVSTSTGNKKHKFFYGYIVVIAAFFILVILFGTQYSFGVFFKPVLTEFSWTRAMTAGAYSLNQLLQGAFAIFAGRLNDKYGPRIVMTVCGFSIGIGYLLLSKISTIWQMYLLYGVIVAIGMSGGVVPMTSTVARWFVKRRGMMVGLVVCGIGAGTIIMPPIATRLISSYGWSTSFAILGITALTLIIVAAQFLKRDPSKMKLLPDGKHESEQRSPTIEAGGLSLREAILTRQFWVLCTLYPCSGFVVLAIMAHIVIHATDIGISDVNAANIIAIIGGLSIAGRIMMGSASDRIGTKLALVISYILLTAPLFWLLVAKELWALYFFAAILGLGYGGTVALESPTVAASFGLKAHGTILGIVFFSIMVGGAIGPVLFGRIYDTSGSYQLAFIISAVVSTVGLILTFFLRPTPTKV